jgi:serine/threonine protein kinase
MSEVSPDNPSLIPPRQPGGGHNSALQPTGANTLVLDELPRAEWLALLRADQLRRWPRGEGLPVETYRERSPRLNDDGEALLLLAYHEVALRAAGGEHPALEEYCSRFPAYADRLTQYFALFRQPGGAALAPPTPERPALPSVPGFEILAELGRGGMGVVYKAQHLRLKRLVALKMIRAGAGASTEQRARFRAEAEATARLQHPHIVQIHEIGEHQGQPFLSLEFVEGRSLAHTLAGRPLPPGEAAELLETLARAIAHAHQLGIVHRDLKPANILLQEERSQRRKDAKTDQEEKEEKEEKENNQKFGSLLSSFASLRLCESSFIPKLTDFGLAKLLEDDVGHTRTGAILGTPSYMAPEQAAGRTREATTAIDVYALGAILYECLTGRPPFKAATLLETLEQVRLQEPIPPRRLEPRVPRDLEQICLKCLAKEPKRRYASAADLAEDVRRFLDGEPVHARPPGLAERALRTARKRWVALAFALIVLFGGLILVSIVALTTFGTNASGTFNKVNQQVQPPAPPLPRSP